MSTSLLAADTPRFPLARLASAQLLSPRLALCLALLLLAAVSLSSAVPAFEVVPPDPVLRRGTPVSGTLAGGQSATVLLNLRRDDFVQVAVAQQGIDVVVQLRDPTGTVLLAVDSPNHSEGKERIYAVAPEAGEYQLKVSNQDSKPGRYEARIEVLRPAKAQDRRLAQAAKAYDFGERSRLDGERDPTRFGEALREYGWARTLCRGTCHPELESLLQFRLGVVRQSRQEHGPALAYFLRVLPRWRGRVEEIELHNRIGHARMHLGQPFALQSFQTALDLSRSRQNLWGEADSLGNLGSLYAVTGEFQDALDNLRKSLKLWTLLGNQKAKAVILGNLGDVELRLGRPQEAAQDASSALEIRHRAGLGSDPHLLFLRARARLRLRQWQPALMDLEASLDMYLRRHDRDYAVHVLNSIGWVNIQTGKWPQASNALKEAEKLAVEVGNDSGRAAALGLRAELLSKKTGDWQGALPLLLQAVATFDRIGESSSRASSLNGLGFAWWNTGHWREAGATFQRCIDLVEQLREEPLIRDLRSSFLADRQDCFLAYTHLLVDLEKKDPERGYAGQAFEIMERARARSLLDDLAESVNGIRDIDRGLLERKRDLQRRIAMESDPMTALARDGAKFGAAFPGPSRSDLMTQLQAVQAKIQARNSHYAEFTRPRPIQIRKFQDLLDSKTVVLAYLLQERGSSLLWRISLEDVKIYELPAREEIEGAAAQFYESVSQSPRGRRRSTKPAALLSRLLLDPVAGDLGDHRLVILPDGALNHIPFSALPDPEAPPGELVPLGSRHEISYLPSASALELLRKETAERPRPPKTVAVLADGVFQGDDGRFPRAFREPAQQKRGGEPGPPKVAGIAGFERLPYTKNEAEAIRRLVPAGMYFEALGFAANRQLAMRPELGQYKIVHFATHGRIDETDPRRSGLQLSLYDEQRRPQNGLVSLYDIYSLDLPVDLVVLSACRTALGKEVRGEGLIGLTRAFMYAGAPRVVVSLWNVNDEATAQLMDFFYEGLLGENLPAAAALHQAQKRMRAHPKWSAPYYWAGFVLQGDWR